MKKEIKITPTANINIRIIDTDLIERINKVREKGASHESIYRTGIEELEKNYLESN